MLKQRVITAIILMLALTAATTLLSGFSFAILMALVVMLASWEWSRLIGLTETKSRVAYFTSMTVMLGGLFPLLGVTPSATAIDSLRVSLVLVLASLFWFLALFMLRGYPANAVRWNDKSRIAAMSVLALLPTWAGMVQLKYLAPEGYLVLAMVVMVAAVDIGGYFVGRKFGHTRLAPNLSPSKSWEGVWGGLAACLLLGILLIWALHTWLFALSLPQILLLLALSISVVLIDVIGDLTVSMLKRNRDLKDSSGLLPGHGGIMDRVDGLVAVTPVFTLTLLFIMGDIE